jgi:hypothetical protein
MTGYELTAHDTRALRHADAIVLQHIRDEHGERGELVAILDAEHSATGYEQRHIIPCELSSIRNYGSDDDGPFTASHVMMYARTSAEAHTLTRQILRTGTRVALQWTRSNQSPVLTDAGVVRDELRIRVQARGASQAFTYLVAVLVGKDNSARMIRPIGSYAHGTSGIR